MFPLGVDYIITLLKRVRSASTNKIYWPTPVRDSLYTFTDIMSELGSGLPLERGFPEFTSFFHPQLLEEAAISISQGAALPTELLRNNIN
jgi:hypothetical protein